MSYDFRRKVGTLILTVLFVFSATFAFGQIVTGSLSGVVEDQQHAMVSGAKITAHQDGTSFERTTMTTDAGLFTLTGLPVGAYTVTIEAAKFSKLKINNVGITVAKDTSLGVRTLTIGTTEVVNVEGTAPLVESTTTQISTSFESKKVADLPVGSGYDLLALFVPGIAPAGEQGFSNNNGADISANGQRGRSNNFQIDGQSNNDNSVAGPSIFLGNQDLIGEFQVITNYSAEFGRNMGSVINYITKGGTNSFHGTLFEYHSTNWGQSLANEEKSQLFGFCAPGAPADPDGVPLSGDECSKIENPKFIDNRWGLTFGGPIVKDKAWFFFSYMGEHIRNAGSPSTATGVQPTPAGMATLLAAYPTNNFVNALNTIGPFAIAAGNPRCNQGSQTLLTVTDGALSTPGVEFCNPIRTLPFLFNDRELTGRVDIQLSSKDRLTARYIIQDFNNINATGRFGAGTVVDVPGRTQQIALDWTRSFTSRFVNSFRFNYSRAGFFFEGGTFPDCKAASFDTCPTGFTFSGASGIMSFGMQNNFPQGRVINNSQWQDNASWVHGRHTIKFGGEYARQRSPNAFLPNILGTYSFSGGNPSAGTSLAFNRAMTNSTGQQGLPNNGFSITDGSMFFEFKEQDAAFYAQDEWRAKDNLTLIFGLRWEFYQQALNQLHDQTVRRESDPATAIWNGTLSQDLTTYPHTPNDMNNWGPNVGFAWTPKIWKGLFGENKTVIRGGFRITYDPSFYNIFLNSRTAAPVVNAGFFLCNAAVQPCIPADPTAAGVRAQHLPDVPSGTIGLGDPSCTTVTTGVDPGCRNQTLTTDNFHNPYSEQWNFGVQRQITNKMAVEVRYVGNHTIGNFQTINANPILWTSNGFPTLQNNGVFGNGDDGGLIGWGFDGSGVCGPTGATFACPNLIPAGLTPCLDNTRPGQTVSAATAIRYADCNKRNVRLRANSAFSNYQGMQTRFDISNWHGVTANFGYTWAHTIDNVSEIFSTFGGGTTIAGAQNPFDTNRGERGNSGLDYRHIATLALLYELPWYKSQQGVMGHLFGGWQFNITHRYTSGQPWTPAQFAGENTACQNSFDAAFFGGGDTCRPFLSNPNAPIGNAGLCTDHTLSDCGLIDLAQFNIGNVVPVTFDQVRYILNGEAFWTGFNEAALFFGTPYGSAPRNSERGETINNTNFSLFKTTRITERVKVRFEFHAWNLLNRQFKGDPDPFVDDVPIAGFTPGCACGSFGNTFFNPSGGFSSNVTQSGIGRRRLNFGIKIVF